MMAALPAEQDNTAAAPDRPQVGQMYPLPELPQKEIKRRQRIAETWKAYKGEWGNGPLKVNSGDPDDNVRPNVCQPIVDVGVNFLFGEPVTIEISNETGDTGSATDNEAGAEIDVDNGAEQGTSPAQAYLEECWGDEDDKMTLLTEVGMNGAMAGSAFVMIVPANEDMGEDCPHVEVIDPANVTVMTEPHNCKVVREYWIQYDGENYDLRTGQPQITTYRKVITRNDPDGLAIETTAGYDADDSWLILDYERKGLAGMSGHSGGYRSSTGTQTGAWLCTAVTEWPKPYPPIVDCQNLPSPNEYWGLSDLPPDLVQMNRALIFNESNIMRTIKHYVAPMRYGSGVTAASISYAPDKMLLLQSPDAKIQALDVKADLANAMAYSKTLLAHMDQQSQIPGIALGRLEDMPKGALPGVTIRALYKPPMSKTTKKRRLYGKLIREVSLRLLDLGGYGAAAKAKILLHWGDPLPSDDLVAAQTAQVWQGIGVSADTLLQQNGFDPDVEAEKKQQEDARKVVAFSQGQGLPPDMASMPPEMGDDQQQQQQQQQQSAAAGEEQGNKQQQPAPPMNHPAAVRQRAAVKQMSQMMKGQR